MEVKQNDGDDFPDTIMIVYVDLRTGVSAGYQMRFIRICILSLLL